jgi:preprotein translocase subunit SecG
MMPLVAISVLQYFFGTVLFVLSAFLVLLVLVQRGRGGGLTGALGGPGGQSAFGTKAGDVFTRVTIIVAAVWIFLNAFAVWSLQEKDFAVDGGPLPTAVVSPTLSQDPSPVKTGITGASDMGLGDVKVDSPSAPTTENATPEVTSETFPKTEGSGAETPAAPPAETPQANAPAAATPANTDTSTPAPIAPASPGEGGGQGS